MNSYTIMQVVQALGIPRERFKEWVWRGFITPSVQKATGPGTANLYSRGDLYKIELFNRLINRGLSREKAAESAKRATGWIQSVEKDIPDGKIMIAFFNRPKGADRVYRNGVEQRPLTDFRIFTGKALKMSFQEAFITLEDAYSPEKYDTSKLDFDDVLLVNFTRIRTYVDLQIEKIK